MQRKFASFNNLYFSDMEPITSYKLNQINALMEEVRLACGPYNVTKTAQNATSFEVDLLEDPTKIGGLVVTGGGLSCTRWSFLIFYETRASISGDYACWETFFDYDGFGRLYAVLNSGDNIYNNAVNVSNVDTRALYCIKSSGYMVV